MPSVGGHDVLGSLDLVFYTISRQDVTHRNYLRAVGTFSVDLLRHCKFTVLYRLRDRCLTCYLFRPPLEVPGPLINTSDHCMPPLPM